MTGRIGPAAVELPPYHAACQLWAAVYRIVKIRVAVQEKVTPSEDAAG